MKSFQNWVIVMQKTDAIMNIVIQCALGKCEIDRVISLVEDQKNFISQSLQREIEKTQNDVDRTNIKLDEIEKKIEKIDPQHIDTMVHDIRHLYSISNRISNLIDHDPLLHPPLDQDVEAKILNDPVTIIINNPNDPMKVFQKFRDLGESVKCVFSFYDNFFCYAYGNTKITASTIESSYHNWRFPPENDLLSNNIEVFEHVKCHSPDDRVFGLKMEVGISRKLCIHYNVTKVNNQLNFSLLINDYKKMTQIDTIPHTIDLMRKLISIPDIPRYLERNGFKCICRKYDNNEMRIKSISSEWWLNGLRSIKIYYDYSDDINKIKSIDTRI
jgi:hypothetical protein